MASFVRGESVGPRPDAPAERPSAHHRRCHAAAIRLVRQRWVLASALADAHGRAVDQSDREARAGRLESSCGRAVQRARQAPRAGEAVDVSGAGFHREAAELSGRDGRERRDADEPAAAPGRSRVPAPHRVRQCGQPATDARHRSCARDGRADVDWRRPSPPARSAPDRKRAALARRRRARRPVRLPGHPFDRRADARVLRAERVARRHQHPGAGILARRVVADRDSSSGSCLRCRCRSPTSPMR